MVFRLVFSSCRFSESGDSLNNSMEGAEEMIQTLMVPVIVTSGQAGSELRPEWMKPMASTPTEVRGPCPLTRKSHTDFREIEVAG